MKKGIENISTAFPSLKPACQGFGEGYQQINLTAWEICMSGLMSGVWKRSDG
jgi:hypothetical protein